MSVHVVVPDERAAQLREIADALNLPSVAAAVGVLINHAYSTGLVTRSLPGIAVRRKGKRVEIDFGDFIKSYPVELAKAAATGIRFLAKPRTHDMSKAMAAVAEAIGGFEHVGISRQGPAVKFTEGDQSRTLAFSVAIDLAEEIERIASA